VCVIYILVIAATQIKIRW